MSQSILGQITRRRHFGAAVRAARSGLWQRCQRGERSPTGEQVERPCTQWPCKTSFSLSDMSRQKYAIFGL